MGAAETWQDLLRTQSTALLDHPLHFSLDGEQWNHDIPAHLDSNKVKERENWVALIGAWWRLSWQAVCNEVSQRYGETPLISCKSTTTTMAVSFTFLAMYQRLHVQPTDEEALNKREIELTAVCANIEAWNLQEIYYGRASRLAYDLKPNKQNGRSAFDKEIIAAVLVKHRVSNKERVLGSLDLRRCTRSDGCRGSPHPR